MIWGGTDVLIITNRTIIKTYWNKVMRVWSLLKNILLYYTHPSSCDDVGCGKVVRWMTKVLWYNVRLLLSFWKYIRRRTICFWWSWINERDDVNGCMSGADDFECWGSQVGWGRMVWDFITLLRIVNNDPQPFWLQGLVSWKTIFPWTWDGRMVQ